MTTGLITVIEKCLLLTPKYQSSYYNHIMLVFINNVIHVYLSEGTKLSMVIPNVTFDHEATYSVRLGEKETKTELLVKG